MIDRWICYWDTTGIQSDSAETVTNRRRGEDEDDNDDDELKDDLKLSCAVIECKSCEIAEDR